MNLTMNSAVANTPSMPEDRRGNHTAKTVDCVAIQTMPLAAVLYLALFGDLALHT